MNSAEKDLTDASKISARSLPEVQLAINLLVARCRAAGRPLFHGNPLTKESYVNAAVLYVEALPPEKRMEAIEFGLARLAAMMRGEDGGEGSPPVGPGERVEQKVERVKPRNEGEGPPPRGRKRRA